MPPWLSNLLQNRAFWAAVLFIGIPVIRAIISAAAKARERKLALDRVRATELETLRTGPRPSGEQPMSARQQLETMAAQRRASSPAPPPMPASVPAAASQQSPVPVQRTSGAAAQIRAAQRSAGRSAPQTPPLPKKASKKQRVQQPMAQAAEPHRASTPQIDEVAESSLNRRGLLERLAVENAESEAADTLRRNDTPRSRTAAIFGPGATLSKQDWRWAFVLREVLGPPVSMRESA
jgi:hypothetical protein